MTVTPDQPHAPGCFGSAICYKAGSPECASCLFQPTCAPASQQRAEELRLRFGIKPKVEKAKPEPISNPSSSGLTVPKKVEELLQRIERAGIQVTASLAKGVNPFATRPVFLRIACHLLLRRPQGFTRAELTRGLVSKLEWSQATATAHAAQAFQVLIALGAAEEVNGTLQLRKVQ